MLTSRSPAKALDLDPKNVKALYRRGLSQLAILQPRPAIIDLKALLVLDPKNAEARKQLDATVKLVRRMEFEKCVVVNLRTISQCNGRLNLPSQSHLGR